MRLFWLVLFIVSHIAHSFALVVVIEPYNDVNYEEINAYDLNEEKKEECDCHKDNYFFDSLD